jgi:hypothetical protein
MHVYVNPAILSLLQPPTLLYDLCWCPLPKYKLFIYSYSLHIIIEQKKITRYQEVLCRKRVPQRQTFWFKVARAAHSPLIIVFIIITVNLKCAAYIKEQQRVTILEFMSYKLKK